MQTTNISFIEPKIHQNYVAFFLTLACNLHCSYCINMHGTGSRYQQAKRPYLTADEWIKNVRKAHSE